MSDFKIKDPGSPASDKQVGFIKKLLNDKQVGADHAERVLCSVERGMPKGKASDTISWLLDQPAKATVPAQSTGSNEKAPELEEGVYVLFDGPIVRVQRSKRGGLYAKVWVDDFHGLRLTLSGDKVKGRWEYAPGVVKNVKPENRMSIEDAKAFTLLYGQCARCGRTLKAAESVEKGLGPVCEKWFGGF